MPQPFVSVVTPVHNGEPYLAECIESVLAQTYENWDYSIVDNHSTDGSLETARRYARQDPRIRVVEGDGFLKHVASFNRSMEHISPRSKYCKVVHADDLLFPECIARMVEVAERHPSVGMVAAYSLYGDRVKLDGIPFPARCLSGTEVSRSMLLSGRNAFGSPTASLIRSDIVRSRRPFYDASAVYCDMDVGFRILREHDYGFVHQVLTYTRVHQESITSQRGGLRVHKLAQLEVLKRYGESFLSAEEYERRLSELLREYYGLLGRHIFRLADDTFWRLHRKRLEDMGERLRYGRVARAGLVHIGRRVLHPWSTVRRRLRRPSVRSEGAFDV